MSLPMPSADTAVSPAPAPLPASWRDALSSDLRAYWLLWLIAALAVVTRFYEFGRIPGMHGDEGWYGVQILELLNGRAGELRTPTGNVPGLIHSGSLLLLHSLFSPSLWLLRLPVLISSLGAMAAAYAVGRRFFGPAAGMSALVLMAALPVNLAYARLGWDPSHAPLLVLLAAYCALAGRRLLAALVFALAVANHPAAVFIAPFLALGHFGLQRESLGWSPALLRTAPLVLALLLATFLSLWLSAGASHYLDASKSLTRLADPGLWTSFAIGLGRLLSGDTIYRYIVGEGYGAAGPWVDAVAALLLTALIVAGLLGLERRDWAVASVVAGWLASVAGLYIVAGLWVLQPSFERFAFPMVPLTALAAAAVVGQWLPRRMVQPALAALALPLLASFWLYYLIPLDNGRARPKPGSWTGPVEPNQAATELIARAARPAGGARVIAEDWWAYWPAAYYAAGKPLVLVDASGPVASPAPPAYPGGTYWIAYGGGRLDRALAVQGNAQPRWTVATSNPGNVLKIWWSPPAGS